MDSEKKLTTESAQCSLCPHQCQIPDGKWGFCHGRRAENGLVVDDNYGRLTAFHLDPIEKKPLAHFHPGSAIASVGSYGCNMRCPFCQNFEISMADDGGVSWHFCSPEEVVQKALELRRLGNIGIAYTYNEPLVGFEFVRDCAHLAHEAGLLNVVVSNGMINAAPLQELLPLIDAANIDLKGFNESVYRQLSGDLDCVKSTIEMMAACATCHLEVTTLVVPGLNDDPKEIEASARWLASLDPEIVWHLTRFFPRYKMSEEPATPVSELTDLVALAKQYLPYVYAGNV